MMQIMGSWLFVVCLVTPTLCTVCALYVWLWRKKKPGVRQPVSKKLLRPAGESLRLEIVRLEEQLGERVALAMIVPIVVMLCVVFSSPDGRMSNSRLIAAFVSCALTVPVMLRRVFETGTELRKYRLGFHGERAVGEELNQLMLDGCRVIHDVPIDPYGNVDHVIVSSAGVFAVETKTRRKRPTRNGAPEHEAVFDGETVKFPTWKERKMVMQARVQADHLRGFLTRAVGEPVTVTPILCLPGWFVPPHSPADGLLVLNEGMIRKHVTEMRDATLTPQMIQRIAHQLEQRCRDVEL